jgi:iron complex outermembrane recepter protein
MKSTTGLLLAGISMMSFVSAARAQDAAPTDSDAAEIIVIGRGETRQVQEIGQADIAPLAPGTTALKALEKLPSVNFQSADAFGAYEWSQRITVRGFNQSQLGFTLDGVPLGNQNYGNVNGLHTNRAISPENVGTTRLTQGAGAVGTQATNNLGGTIALGSREPATAFGFDGNFTYGSDNTIRGFARIDTGGEAARGFLSYGYLTTDKWKGFGRQYQHVANAKGVIDAGAAKITGYFSFSDRREQDYQDLSLDIIRRLGANVDNISNNYAVAQQIADVANNIDLRNNTTGALGPDGLSDITGNRPTNPGAGTTFPAPFGTVDDVYFDASGLRKDYLGYVGVDVPLGDSGNGSAALKGYFHNNDGQGTWFTPYVPSPTGVPISVRTTEYTIRRKGVFGSVSNDWGFGQLTLGAWYERNDFRQARRFYALTSRTVPGRSALRFQSDPFATQWDFNYTADIVQYYVQDKIEFGGLTLDLGWKGFSVKNSASPIIQGGRAAGSIKVDDWFQPSVGVNYKIGNSTELYASFSQSTAAFVSAFTAGPFSTTQDGFNAIRTTLKPEASDTYEAGARFKAGGFNGSIGAYLVNFRNRLLAISTGAGIVGNPPVLQNVGGVRSIGVELAGNYRFGGGFSLFGSYSYNDATYRNDVVNAVGTVLAAIKGKTIVDAPQHLLKFDASYDSENFFGRVGVNYMSKRFFTYTNALTGTAIAPLDRAGFVDGRALIDATLGYRFALGPVKKAEIQLNVTNLFDKDYISTIGTNGFGNIGDNQTLLNGAPRQIFATLKVGF